MNADSKTTSSREALLETALEGASNPDDFKLRVEGIASSSDMAREDMQSAVLGR